MKRFCNKLVSLSKLVNVTDKNKNTLACYVICQFSVDYKCVTFYSPGVWSYSQIHVAEKEAT
jgi:hypothetical protein